jgi:hypothetical protein
MPDGQGPARNPERQPDCRMAACRGGVDNGVAKIANRAAAGRTQAFAPGVPRGGRRAGAVHGVSYVRPSGSFARVGPTREGN